jgi:hypothetical protein
MMYLLSAQTCIPFRVSSCPKMICGSPTCLLSENQELGTGILNLNYSSTWKGEKELNHKAITNTDSSIFIQPNVV